MNTPPSQRPDNPAPRTGFTLIELLVVIAIIAILAALVVPSTATVLERGREMKCQSNERQIVAGCLAYEKDHDHLPYTWQWVPPNYDWWTVDLITNVIKNPDIVFPYMADVGVYLCPTFYRVVSGVRPDAHRSYSMNFRVDAGYSIPGAKYPSQINAWKSAKVKSPSICGMIGEENMTAPTYVGATKMNTTALNDGLFAWTGGDCLGTYHRDLSANRACFDGHAERVIMDEQGLWRNNWYTER